MIGFKYYNEQLVMSQSRGKNVSQMKHGQTLLLLLLPLSILSPANFSEVTPNWG